MIRSPDVIFSQIYYRKYPKDFTSSKRYLNKSEQYKELISNSNWFFGVSRGTFTSYISRDKGCSKEDVAEGRLREKGYSDNEVIDYMKNRPGSCGLFDENGSIDEESYRELQNFMRETPNAGWTCVLSFTEDFSKEHCNNPYQAQQMLKKVIPQQLKLQGLNPSDFRWFGAYHTNTDNRHIHYAIVPNLSCKKFKALTSKEVLDTFRRWIIKEYPLNNRSYSLDRDLFLQDFDKAYKDAMPMLTAQAFNIISHKKQYARLTKDERETINSYAWGIINSNEDLKKDIEIIKDWTYQFGDAGFNKSDLWYDFTKRLYNRTMKYLTEQAKKDGIKWLADDKEKESIKTKGRNRKRSIGISKTRKKIRKSYGSISNLLKQLIVVSCQEVALECEKDWARIWRNFEKEMEEQQHPDNEEEIEEYIRHSDEGR